jgi:hypothetical protein
MLFGPLDPGSGMKKIRIRDQHGGSYFRELSIPVHFYGLRIFKFFVADPGTGAFFPWIRNEKMRIRAGFATLVNNTR